MFQLNAHMTMMRSRKFPLTRKRARTIPYLTAVAASPAAAMRILSAGLILLFATLASVTAYSQELAKVRGDLYRFTSDDHSSIIYVTEEGVVIGDPINRDAAVWLKAEIEKQFAQPVKFMFYSHHDADHASGGEVFAESGTVVVAHENAAQHIQDKGVKTATPDIVFSDSVTLRVGGKQVELHYLGKNLTDDMIVAHFPAEEAVFAVDFVAVESLPRGDLAGAFLPDWYTSINRLAQIPFTYLIPGQGEIGIHYDAIEHGHYLRELENRVRRAHKAGATLEEMQSNIKLPRYKDWSNYEQWLPDNILGIYNALQLGDS